MRGLEQIEAKAYAAFAEATGGGGSTAVRGGVCIHSPLPLLIVNRVVCVTDELDLDEVADAFEQPYLVCVPPWVESLDAELGERGYTQADSWAKLTRGNHPAQPAASTLRIERTTDGTVFGATAAEGFGAPPEAFGRFAVLERPGFAGFVAWSGDEPAACGAVLVDGAHGWFGVAATRPAFRGQGAQQALIAARIEHARAAGATTLSVETAAPGAEPGPSYRNVVRAGFVDAYVRRNWRSPG